MSTHPLTSIQDAVIRHIDGMPMLRNAVKGVKMWQKFLAVTPQCFLNAFSTPGKRTTDAAGQDRKERSA